MKDGPNIIAVAALIGDPTRVEVLTALMAGGALTATELAAVAGVTRQTISAHLARLVEGGLLAVEAQGRHRYFRLADADVAGLLESLMGVAFRTGALRVRSSPREPALRRARVCYDHLAGATGVLVYENLLRLGAFDLRDGGVSLSATGRARLLALGIEAEQVEGGRRPACRTCLDWSERRHHLAGGAGAALLRRMLELDWVRRVPGTRVLAFAAGGEAKLLAWSSASGA